MSERISILVRDAIWDAARLAKRQTDAVKHEALEAAALSSTAASLSVAGLLAALLGAGFLLSTPLIARRHLGMRRRVLYTSLVYLGGGGLVAALGLTAVRRILRETASRTVHDLTRTAYSVRHSGRKQHKA